MRLVLHTAADWLMLGSANHPQIARAGDFRIHHSGMRLLKIAGCISETATRVRIAFAAACPQAALFRGIALSFQSAGP